MTRVQADSPPLPPFLLPAAHFVAVLLWLGVAAAGLVVIAPQLAAGNLFDPPRLRRGVCVTLGVVTTAIFGAL